MKKILQDDICPCGSGKKYEECCMRQEKKHNQEFVDFSWNKIRRTEGEIIDLHLLPYVEKMLPDETIALAWDDFICSDEEFPEEIYENLYKQMFIPWFLFNWIPERDEKPLIDNDHEDCPIALQYLEVNKAKLTDYQIRFIKEICKTHFSFYLILDVEPEKSLLLKDILLNTEYRVKERQGTRHMQRGDVTFARVLKLDDQAICVGIAPCVFPAHYHLQLIDFRDELVDLNRGKKLSSSLLRNEFEILTFSEFFDILDDLYNPSLPELRNTDGDPIQPCKVYFELKCDPKAAFDKLSSLAFGCATEELLLDAEFDKSGKMLSINFPWMKKGNKRHKNWQNTVIGNIEINGKKLLVDVNSKKRVDKIKQLITKRLGAHAEFKAVTIESLEKALQNRSMSHSLENNKDDINSNPEVQEVIKKLAKQHWENWLDESVPALNGMTPREAAKTKKGKERLEALLLEFESRIAKKDDLSNPDIIYLKHQLKI